MSRGFVLTIVVVFPSLSSVVTEKMSKDMCELKMSCQYEWHEGGHSRGPFSTLNPGCCFDDGTWMPMPWRMKCGHSLEDQLVKRIPDSR